MTVRILTGDCRTMLATLPDASVQCCVTSPPYFGLRDYQVAGQIGLEATPDAYVAELVAVFREVRRVLADTGVAFLNLGDSYCSTAPGTRNAPQPKGSRTAADQWANVRPELPDGMKPKDLIGIPWSVAFALRQPQHYGPIQKEADRAWLAAIIDGEGTIGIKRDRGRSNGGTGECQNGYSVYVSVGNQDKELLDRCAEITGGGWVNVKDRPFVDGRGIQSRRTYYGWRIEANKAIAVIRDIFPFLVVKKRQAILAYTLDLSNKAGRSMRGNGVLPEREQEKRERLKALCNACNQREPVDMPDWAMEPPTNFEQGWWLRSAITWCKTAPMPESVVDRPTSATEMVFLLTKASRYFYDSVAVREDCSETSHGGPSVSPGDKNSALGKGHETNKLGKWTAEDKASGRNLRNWWVINPQPYSGAHFATMPPDLASTCIRAGSSERGQCPHCAAPWARVLGDAVKTGGRGAGNGFARPQRVSVGGRGDETPWEPKTRETTGWSPTCSCPEHAPVPQTVLDPFGGAGTTGLVADRLGRNAVLIELNPDYAKLARNRVTNDAPLFAEVAD